MSTGEAHNVVSLDLGDGELLRPAHANETLEALHRYLGAARNELEELCSLCALENLEHLPEPLHLGGTVGVAAELRVGLKVLNYKGVMGNKTYDRSGVGRRSGARAP